MTQEQTNEPAVSAPAVVGEGRCGQCDMPIWTRNPCGLGLDPERAPAEAIARCAALSPTPPPAIPDREEIVGVIRELSDELEAEIQGRASGELPRRIARDMETVTRARSLLAKLEGKS